MVFCVLRGGFKEELSAFKKAQVVPLKEYFSEAFFETKKLVYYPLN